MIQIYHSIYKSANTVLFIFGPEKKKKVETVKRNNKILRFCLIVE